jgi:hypothetical protein
MLVARRQQAKIESERPRRLRRRVVVGGLAALVVVLLISNTLLVNAETRSAELTHPRGQLLDLPGGEQQVSSS